MMGDFAGELVDKPYVEFLGQGLFSFVLSADKERSRFTEHGICFGNAGGETREMTKMYS